MLRSPKERFQKDTNCGLWKKMVESMPCEEAMHSALEQLASELPQDCAAPQQACDAYQQMIGARKYMEILSSLHIPETSPKTIQTKSLDYGSGV